MNENHQHRLDQIENWKKAGDYYRAAEKMWQEATTKGLSLQSEPIIAIMKAQGFLDKDQVDQLFRDIATQAYQAYADPIKKTTKAFETAIGDASSSSGAVWTVGQLSTAAKDAADNLALLPGIIQKVMDHIRLLTTQGPSTQNKLDKFEILQAVTRGRYDTIWLDSKKGTEFENALRAANTEQTYQASNYINLYIDQNFDINTLIGILRGEIATQFQPALAPSYLKQTGSEGGLHW